MYAIKEARLRGIIGRALVLGCSRVQELRSYLLPGSGLDLADCVENILNCTVSLPILYQANPLESRNFVRSPDNTNRYSSPTLSAPTTR